MTSHVHDATASGSARHPDASEVLERFHQNLELVDRIASNLQNRVGSVSLRDDLVAAGREGLLEASRRYDASRGVPFQAYATYRIRGAMIDDMRRNASFPRRAYERCVALSASSEVSKSELGYVYLRPEAPRDLGAAEELLADHMSAMALAAALAVVAGGASPDREAAEEASGNPEQAFARAELWNRVQGALDELAPEARAIVRRHYLEGERLEDIARGLSVSKSWVSRLLTRTMARLGRRLRALS